MFEVPADVKAAIGALRFDAPDMQGLRNLSSADWTNLLTRYDFLRLTIPLRKTCGDEMPGWVRSRVDRHIADNAERLERIKTAYSEIAAAFRDSGVEHIVLKGFAQWPGFTDHPCFHPQSDIDLYCPPNSLSRAYQAALALGYRSAPHRKRVPEDHLPSLTRNNGWHWTGNHFDPEMPPSLELHKCFWNRREFRFGVEVEEDFWSRREKRRLDDLCFRGLSMADNLGHSALQILKDCIQDAVSVAKLYELARFLHSRAGDEAFWIYWSELHDKNLRQMEAISFRAARQVFGCRLPELAEKEVRDLPSSVEKWFQLFEPRIFDRAPHRVRAGVWLQTSLIESPAEKRAAIVARCRPRRPISEEAFAQRERVVRPVLRESDSRVMSRQYWKHIRKEGAARLRAAVPTACYGARYWWSTKELTGAFWKLFAASFLFDLGVYIFFLLYNLYLIDRGFNAQFIGFIASATSVGSIAGTILGGLLAHRIGLRRMLIMAFPLVALLYTLRATISAPSALIALALLGGAAATFWAIGLAPAVAQLTTEKNRSFAFSVILSTGIAVGILGGFTGGHLPGWLAAVHAVSPIQAKRGALIVACGLIAAAAWPISKVRFAPIAARKRALYPRNPFLWRFLPAMAVWSLATGAFTPFFNAYFSQHDLMSVSQIGTMFSLSHVAQMFAVLAAPLLFRRAGLVKGIVLTQVATGAALALLAAVPAGIGAAAVYTAFSAFEWMNEPGLFTLLMDGVNAEERTGASALMFLVVSCSQATVGVLAGAGYARFGYEPVMLATAVVAVLAAALFGTILRDPATALLPAKTAPASLRGTPRETARIRANS